MKTNRQTKSGQSLKVKLAIALICTVGFVSAQEVTTLAGSIEEGSDSGIGAAASFYDPQGVVTDGNGNLYVADAGNNAIRKIVISTGTVTTFAGLAGMASYGSANGTDTTARFFSPTGMTIDGCGNLYVADALNNEIRKIVIATGAVTTLAGHTLSGASDGTGTAASFFSPTGIIYDGSGSLYVADKGNNEIRKVAIATGVVTTIAGSWRITGSANGIGSAASFYEPAGVAVDGNGNLYVADGLNNEIRKIDIATGKVSTLAGSIKPGSADGIGAMAGFNTPTGLTYDGNGNLYVADRNNNEIRKIVICNGTVTTIAGSTSSGSSNGIGTNASFYSPLGLTIDNNSNIYVADTRNNEIRMIGSLFTGINEIAAATSLSVYPNPASQNINLSFKNQNKSMHADVRIVDITGKEEMSTSAMVSNGNPMTINISTLTHGVYFAQVVMDDNTTQVSKFIKQ